MPHSYFRTKEISGYQRNTYTTDETVNPFTQQKHREMESFDLHLIIKWVIQKLFSHFVEAHTVSVVLIYK